MENRPKIMAVDFDGCLVKNKFPEIGELNNELADYLRKEKDYNNTEIIIWTCRSEKYIEPVRKFLKENNIPFDYINENVEWLPFETSRKVYADIYIDDRAKFISADGSTPELVKMVDEKEANETLKNNRGGCK